jgi:hypothetical protein
MTTLNFAVVLLLKKNKTHFSAPQEGENYQNNKSLAELQARKNAIDMVSAICRVATDVLRRAQFAAEGEFNSLSYR